MSDFGDNLGDLIRKELDGGMQKSMIISILAHAIDLLAEMMLKEDK